jgi:general secretion pathway protein G
MNFQPSGAGVRMQGFTIVELLIVIVVIGILAGITLNVYAKAQTQAKVSQAKSDLATIKRAMTAYRIDLGELPPAGDAWNYDTDPPSESGWRPVLEDMEENGFLGHGLVDKLVKDPWGHAYGYDDNDCGSFAGDESPTYLQSVGPNGHDNESGDSDNDDILLLISKGCIY